MRLTAADRQALRHRIVSLHLFLNLTAPEIVQRLAADGRDISLAFVTKLLKENADFISEHHSRQIASLTRAQAGLLALARDIAITATPSAVQTIITNLSHPDPRIRNEAAKTLITMNLTGSTAEKLIFPTSDAPQSHETSEKTALVLAEAVKLMLQTPLPPSSPTLPTLPEHIERIRAGQRDTPNELDATSVEILPPRIEPKSLPPLPPPSVSTLEIPTLAIQLDSEGED